ncbi:hypothetical protein WR25_12845 [Diploscapter pachys]|uniref:Uncharacterized protein n=1 Tax=Diploscapter pachys TaxID=2018661 RepID=A0A2A2JBW4_9BILA|nr:hypothetical protein WR25_12845 [Diploscapter pachys]
MEIASIQSLSGSSPGSGFNPAADLKQLDDINGAIINLEMCKKISNESRRVESQGYSTVLQRERDEREQLRQRFFKEQEEKMRQSMEKRKSEEIQRTAPSNAQNLGDYSREIGSGGYDSAKKLKQNGSGPCGQNMKGTCGYKKWVFPGFLKMSAENMMHAKRKPDQWMQYPTGPQTMTPQQYYVQSPNPHTMMMQRQHSAPALPQNGYDIHPAFRPNGIGAMGHSYPPQQVPNTPPVPQAFAQNQGCTTLPSTSTESMPPANVSSGYMANQQNYAQPEQTPAQFPQQATSPANGTNLNMNPSPATGQVNQNSQSQQSQQSETDLDTPNLNENGVQDIMKNIAAETTSMLPELGGDLDDELFGNSDSGNQPSTSNPTSVQAQNDAQNSTGTPNGIVLPPSHLSANHVMSPQNQMPYNTTPHHNMHSNNSANGPSSVHSIHSNPLSNGNCATPITPGSSQMIAGPMSVHQQQQQPINRPPSNSMQQQLTRAPSAPNANAFPQQVPPNQMPMAQNGPNMIAQPNAPMPMMIPQQQQQQQVMIQGQSVTQPGSSYYQPHPGMMTHPSMIPHAQAAQAQAQAQAQYRYFHQQQQLHMQQVMMQRQGMQFPPQYYQQMRVAQTMPDDVNGMQRQHPAVMMDPRMAQMEMANFNQAAYPNGMHLTMFYQQQQQQRLQAAPPNYPPIN